MLVLSRKLNESICIGEDIVVKVVKIRGNVIGLGIVAPENVKIMRNELLERDADVARSLASTTYAVNVAG